jgi:hypothetical protein
MINWFGEDVNAGWIDAPELNAPIVESLEYRTFGDTPAMEFPVSDLPKVVYLWKDASKVYGSVNLPVANQGQLGACVGFGTVRAIEYTNLCEIANGDREKFKLLSPSITYAGSRVEANGGRSPFRSDGSTGALAAKFSTKWGILDKGVYGKYDLNKYDIPLTRTWASTGIPDELETFIKQHPISNATLVTTIEEAQKALAQGYGISICSSQGFNTKRSVDGICAPSGSWMHCLNSSGYIYIGNELYFYIENSWGSYMGEGNPAPNNANLGTFLAKADVFLRMLGMRDSYAYSGVSGFASKKLDWNI